MTADEFDRLRAGDYVRIRFNQRTAVARVTRTPVRSPSGPMECAEVEVKPDVLGLLNYPPRDGRRLRWHYRLLTQLPI